MATRSQQNSLHLGFQLLAEALNDAGLDMQKVFEVKTVSVPWTKESVKEVLFRPIMSAMTQKGSTTEMEIAEVNEVWMVLNRHLGEHFGVTVEFPHDSD